MQLEKLKASLRGSQFKKILKEKETSKYRISKDLGISQRTLYYWQKDMVQPSDELAIKVGRHLGLIKPDDVTKIQMLKQLKEMKEKVGDHHYHQAKSSE